MPTPPDADWPRPLAAHGRGAWEPVTGGESGARVYRAVDGSRYAKCVPLARRDLLDQERRRIDWLATTGVGGPAVLDWTEDAADVCLVTSAVPGLPADRVPARTLWLAWPAIAEAVRRLHALPARDCPFDRELRRMVAVAEDVVARDAVNPEFLPVDQQHTRPAALLARLLARVDQHARREPGDLVVCHGDLCLPNIVLDPDTAEVTGFVDLGRLGRADRYADLALLLANARETWADEAEATRADEDFAGRYRITLDQDRLRFYRHLDPLTWG